MSLKSPSILSPNRGPARVRAFFVPYLLGQPQLGKPQATPTLNKNGLGRGSNPHSLDLVTSNNADACQPETTPARELTRLA